MRSTFTVLCIILLSACQLSDDGHITDIIHYEKDPSSQSIPLEPTQVNSQFNTSFISDGKYGFHFIYNDPDIDLYELNINFQPKWLYLAVVFVNCKGIGCESKVNFYSIILCFAYNQE